MGARYVLALDQGTTSSRSILFDERGLPVAVAQEEFTQYFPHPGWVEHDPAEIVETQIRTAREVMAKAGVTAGDIAGIGIANQRETTVLWDRATGEAIAPAIVWQDRRTASFCQELKADVTCREMIQERCGLVIDAYFSASKLKWLLDTIPGARQKAEAGKLAFGTIDTWLAWCLSGGKLHLTDPSNASRTMLCRIDTGEWDPDLCALFDIPTAVLPEIRSSSEIYGGTSAEMFGAEIPLAGIAGDQQAALFGQACHRPGMAKNTYGTGCFLLMNTGTSPVRSQHNLLTTIAWRIDGVTEYALEGSVFIGGAVVQWLRDQLGIITSAAEIETLAASVPDSGGVCFVPAFSGLGAPHWDGFARGAIFGLTRGCNKAHLARAALESIALQSRDLLTAMEKDSGIELRELRVDGGASQNDLLMQIQSNLLGVPVVRSTTTETTALGAAYLAGLATGVWQTREEIADNWAEGKRYLPRGDQETTPAIIAGWNKAIQRSKEWVDSD